MSDWTAGYVAEIGYTFGYYPELDPQRVRLAFLNAGLAFPQVGTACELGFGQGLSANLHAAASTVQWYGTDFSPAQAGFAQELARVSGAGALLYDQAFSEFCARSDLPDLDFIGVHGIWSWISDENRAVIVDFVRRKLKVGGVLYISYNTQPGWATMVPVRDLLAEHSEVMSASGQGIAARIDAAMAFADKLLAMNPAYTRVNPHVVERFKMIRDQKRNYLAHEYFNRDWHPMPFSRMARWLAPAKLNFACSAHFPDQIDALNFTPEQQALMKEISDPMFRETVRDFFVNQQFRRDYWVRGARRLNALEQMEGLRAHKVMLAVPRADVSLKVSGGLGEGTMQETVYNPILDALADHQPRTLGQLEQALKEKDIVLAHLREAAMVLSGNNSLFAVQDEAAAGKAKKHTERLNAYICERARGSSDISLLASPVSGRGVPADRFRQLFLLAIGRGMKQPAEWAQFASSELAEMGEKILKDGKALETPEENLAEMNLHANTFSEKQLPIFKALGIA